MFGVENILSLIWRNSKMTITWSSNLTFGRNTLETLDFIWMACYLISQHEIPDLILMCDFFFVQMLGHYYLAVFWVALQSIQYCWAGIAKNMQIIACIWSGIFLEPPQKKRTEKNLHHLKGGLPDGSYYSQNCRFESAFIAGFTLRCKREHYFALNWFWATSKGKFIITETEK